MFLFRNKRYFLWLSIIIAFGIALMQVLNSSIGLIVFLAGFGGLAVLSAIKDMSVPILLFFLPWSPLMKLQPGTMSAYSIALIAIMVIFMFRNSKRFSIGHIFPAALLFAQTLVVKTVVDDPIDNGFILFFVCLILFPIIASEKDKEYDYYTLVLFFSVGIVAAALSAQQLMIFPTISRYITIHEYSSMTRLSGYYGDPNFYSAHITAAIAGILVLLLNETKISRKIILYVFLMVLIYCGFLSVSKSFALVIVAIALLWILEVLFRRGRISGKLMMLLALLIGGTFLLSSILFTDLVDMILGRFFGAGAGSTISEFTTKRTDIWLSYLRGFEDNPMIFIFGKGFSDELLLDRASHNIIIQSIWQFGIVGTVTLFVWVLLYFRSMLRNIRIYPRNLVQVIICLFGAFGPWMALDALMFDEFFLMPFFVSIGVKSILEADIGDESELYDGVDQE